jgi:hypothetical protein
LHYKVCGGKSGTEQGSGIKYSSLVYLAPIPSDGSAHYNMEQEGHHMIQIHHWPDSICLLEFENHSIKHQERPCYHQQSPPSLQAHTESTSQMKRQQGHSD